MVYYVEEYRENNLPKITYFDPLLKQERQLDSTGGLLFLYQLFVGKKHFLPFFFSCRYYF